MRRFYLFILALGLVFQVSAQTPTPFTCTSGTFYQVSGNTLYKYTYTGAGSFSVTTVAAINTSKSTVGGTSQRINAIGYDTISNMIWGTIWGTGTGSTSVQLVEIDANGNATYLTIKNPPSSYTFAASIGFTIGDIHNGYLYLTSGNNGSATASYYVIDINPSRTATYLNFVNPANLTQVSNKGITINYTNNNIADWIYNSNTGMLVAVSSTAQSSSGTYNLVSYNPTTGALASTVKITGIATGSEQNGFGSVFIDATGNLYAFGNSTGNFYQITPAGVATTISYALPGNTQNDGASCPNEIILQVPAAMPITLQSFMVKEESNTASLQWTTVTETNNKGFYVERSTDGQNWQDITFVASKAANGNSSELLNYQYIDEYPQQGYNYYRLKQVDLDGTVTFSDVQSVMFSNTKTRIYPNPTTGSLHVVLSTSATYQLVNTGGAVAMQGSLQSGDNLLNVTGLASGIYFMEIVSDKNVKNTYEVEIR